jgi:hypothetical protein
MGCWRGLIGQSKTPGDAERRVFSGLQVSDDDAPAAGFRRPGVELPEVEASGRFPDAVAARGPSRAVQNFERAHCIRAPGLWLSPARAAVLGFAGPPANPLGDPGSLACWAGCPALAGDSGEAFASCFRPGSGVGLVEAGAGAGLPSGAAAHALRGGAGAEGVGKAVAVGVVATRLGSRPRVGEGAPQSTPRNSPIAAHIGTASP